ncbi:hypothetical protein APHAL10511_002703 [Amanita phalloides]|nr:hypothetical protein APHAL10511_002703 [Amanita phalloides]
MGDIQTRPFSKNYSGLINQSVIAVSIAILCVTGHEIMKRRRRGKQHGHSVGSRDSWEFGYLFQGRCWARYPPPPPTGRPLSWIKEVMGTSEGRLNELRGVDAALYIRFLRGCFWFTSLHTLTTFLILFPIHVQFSDDSVSRTSMTRASISSLVGTSKGLSLLWIHVLLLFWITLTWIATLCWICLGAFNLRHTHIYATAQRMSLHKSTNRTSAPSPHPHLPYTFVDSTLPGDNCSNLGLRSRTIMVSNVPRALRGEKELKDYFTYYLSRKVEKPSIGWTSSIQPGLLNKCCAFLFNRLKKRMKHMQSKPLVIDATNDFVPTCSDIKDVDDPRFKPPTVERIVIARRMTTLAYLVETREEILVQLEAAHIALAKRVLLAVKAEIDQRILSKPLMHSSSRTTGAMKPRDSGSHNEEGHMNQMINTLSPFVEEFGLQRSLILGSDEKLSPFKRAFYSLFHRKLRAADPPHDPITSCGSSSRSSSQSNSQVPHRTIWDALLSLPRNTLDAYQPLISLNYAFAGQFVPKIDYYTIRLGRVSERIAEKRSKPTSDYEPVSTAFVTFAEPADARRACKYLAVHPENPLACLVTMAPAYEDLDWMCVMKPSFNTEFLKNWVIDIGVCTFTLFWLFPVSLLVGLMSIQNVSRFWPSLKSYLDRHPWQEEIIQSLTPTILVALLALLIPIILFLIATKAQTITTLSALHDLILTRYYKFLVVNVLVFFCVGTAALQSFLLSFKSPNSLNLLQIVADSFPSAGPFYVGWLIFSTAIHGCFELALVGLPLLMYPSTMRQVTPRKRAVSMRPPTFNYYYWIPNHLLALHVLLLFSILNPFVLPFGALYFFVQTGVMKNQFIYVYAKHYEGNGHSILIRIVRYSLDGLVLAQAVFLAYMVVLKKSANVGLTTFLVAATVITKLMLTRMCRAQFEMQDLEEADILHGRRSSANANTECEFSNEAEKSELTTRVQISPAFSVLKISPWNNSRARSIQNEVEKSLSIPFDPPSITCLQSSSILPPADSQHSTDDISEIPPVALTDTITQSTALPPELQQYHPVTSHAAPVPWDDQTVVDRPYDNPFYDRPISNVLWLPRNPCGLPDLDDTVGLRKCLSMQASELVSSTATPGESEVESLLRRLTERPFLDGTEEIELPEIIAERIKSKEADVEQASDCSVIRRHKVADRASTLMFQGPGKTHGRSLSDDTRVRRRRSSRLTSSQLASHIFRTKSSDIERGTQLSTHLPARGDTTSTSHGILPPRNVSVHEAIVHEILAEEDMLKHLEEETASEGSSKAAKSWLTSWMFTKVE